MGGAPVGTEQGFCLQTKGVRSDLISVHDCRAADLANYSYVCCTTLRTAFITRNVTSPPLLNITSSRSCCWLMRTKARKPSFCPEWANTVG